MLSKANDSIGFTIRATDGDIGKVSEFYFDDVNWAVRYLVVNTGSWLADRRVLISPVSVVAIEWEGKRFDVRLSKSQVEKSPDIDTNKTVSRQLEADFLLHYGYPSYWDGPHLWGRTQEPSGLNVAELEAFPPATLQESHLRGTKEVAGYHIEGVDGQIGHVEDFVIDDQTWAIRYLVVNTSNWWLGRKVLLAPQWIERVSWAESKVHVDLSLLTIKNGPVYDETTPITAEYESRLSEYYSRQAVSRSKVS